MDAPSATTNGDHTKIAKITRTFLGVEDHGILTATLEVDYGGSGQNIGGYCLDAPAAERGGHRTGSAFGMEWVHRAILACGVRTWEEVKGRTILVYLADDSYNAKVVGFGPLPTEVGVSFMFADLAQAVAS